MNPGNSSQIFPTNCGYDADGATAALVDVIKQQTKTMDDLNKLISNLLQQYPAIETSDSQDVIVKLRVLKLEELDFSIERRGKANTVDDEIK